MLTDCPDRLEADLRRVYPGTSLDDMWAGRVRVSTIASLTMHLPRGSAVWQYYGGHMAITDETESAWLIEHATLMAASSKPEKVKMRPYPVGVREQEKQIEYTSSQADAWRRRQQARLDAADR